MFFLETVFFDFDFLDFVLLDLDLTFFNFAEIFARAKEAAASLFSAVVSFFWNFSDSILLSLICVKSVGLDCTSLWIFLVAADWDFL